MNIKHCTKIWAIHLKTSLPWLRHWCLQLHNLNCLVTMLSDYQMSSAEHSYEKSNLPSAFKSKWKVFTWKEHWLHPVLNKSQDAQKRGVPELHNNAASSLQQSTARGEGVPDILTVPSAALQKGKGAARTGPPCHSALVLVHSMVFSSFSFGSSQ